MVLKINSLLLYYSFNVLEIRYYMIVLPFLLFSSVGFLEVADKWFKVIKELHTPTRTFQ